MVAINQVSKSKNVTEDYRIGPPSKSGILSVETSKVRVEIRSLQLYPGENYIGQNASGSPSVKLFLEFRIAHVELKLPGRSISTSVTCWLFKRPPHIV